MADQLSPVAEQGIKLPEVAAKPRAQPEKNPLGGEEQGIISKLGNDNINPDQLLQDIAGVKAPQEQASASGDQPPIPPYSKEIATGGFDEPKGGDQSKAITRPDQADQRDGFSQALEMMRRNGTDEQTLRVYTNILDVIRLNKSSVNTKAEGFTERLGKDNPLLGLVDKWEQPRVEIAGMPLINASDPTNPSFDLQGNYHNGPEWLSTVCVDDPTIRNESGALIRRKPSGEPNTAWSVQINPGDEHNPGNMYSQAPGQEKPLLTPNLRQRIDDAFQACKEYSEAEALYPHYFLRKGDKLFKTLSQFSFRHDGTNLLKSFDNDKVKGQYDISRHMPEIYKLILAGEVVGKSEDIGFKGIVDRIRGFLHRNKPQEKPSAITESKPNNPPL